MLRALAVLLLAVAMLAPSARAEDVWRAGAAVTVNAKGEPDVWAAGASVRVRGQAARDIWAAGAIVDIDAQAGTDIWAAGSRVNIAGRVGEALNVTGAEVDITARVGGESRVAGARVTFAPDALLDGKVRAAGALVDFRGRGGGGVSLSGAEVTFNGQTTGDVIIRGQKVRVGEEAEIGGDLEIYSDERPEIARQAQIGGRLVTLGLEDADWPEGGGFPALLAALIAPVIVAISAFILGLLAIWLGRGAVEQAIDTFMERPGGSLLRGIVTLLAVFIGAAVLVALFVGFPLGLAILFSAPVLIITGLAGAGLGLGEWVANRAGEPLSAGGRIGLMALGILVLTLVGLIPIAGAILVFLAILMGLGAVVITVLARLRPETPPTGY
ncbi:hypothetical protein [Dichotomicrobium thermohalophilum]|uniref:DUF8173 domain-containing protein n=1 Tax=Dichotomicrobium thermohalophilum TaxID=933063 RepID=A0A397Q5Y5_9HYPH|nr:hypothetical protein [Dichotomicrobium thermohalophilum]RIA56502.1 hypothetical protein BXY53_1608 [Dichotomicrobium thermohalophilum]